MSCKVNRDLANAITRFRTAYLEYNWALKKNREMLVSKEELEKIKLKRRTALGILVSEILMEGKNDHIRQ